MKALLIREKLDENNNSVFSTEDTYSPINHISHVMVPKEGWLKFDYHVESKILTVFGDYEEIYVLYE